MHVKCMCGLTGAVTLAVWACVSCVMLTGTVPGHDAAFLSLLFHGPRFYVFTVVVPCVCSAASHIGINKPKYKNIPTDLSQYGND